MSPHKPSLSITLPRNFSFHYSDNALPRTPTPQTQEMMEEDIVEPPPPPRQVFKVRRRKADSVPRDIIADIEGDSLPTFEMTEADIQSSPESDADFMPGYLAPAASRLPLLSPPKTPVDQITEYTFDNKPNDWYMFHRESLDRPQSSCSTFSNSSLSSNGSDDNMFPSFGGFGAGGDCTSPDSDSNDPFAYNESNAGPVLSPDLNSISPTAKRAKTLNIAKWTAEMDSHLWKTYLRYLEDPELTPFKMLPGTAPPLGVCGRVAREAKHSWKGPRPAGLGLPDVNADTMDHGRPSIARTWSHWPSSESGTRKRLRKLCKRFPSIPPHYQRLMKARTPSPFQSSSPQQRSDAQPSSYKAQSTEAPHIETTPAHPVQPFDFSAPPPSDIAELPSSKPEGWYRRVPRHRAHQKSQSLQIALGRPSNSLELASPFAGSYNTGAPSSSGFSFHQSLGRNPNLPSDAETPLKSPFELHAPMPTSRSLKRRFGILDESPANISRLEDLFSGTTADSTSAAPPPRDRAFSLGAVHDSSRNLSLSFERFGGMDEQLATNPFNEPSSSQLQPPAQDPTRLGSPFIAPSSATHFNTFPRRFTPLGSEMPHQNFRPNFSLEGKFRQLAAESCRRQ
ncbi:hypothetical protein K461DRAFT_150329 [Myriangium duriaei CBS 260.36]|uniref:Uncharacterized protein n=1 Tax=Myriangium duriaei CBS 260.36 TaxID=1168546 RepID=A0A9P4J1Z2_9PEZI|nr:hypothetical protein K461DRAFT_150329 [Myriangium duriaei CBS 260.36]